MKKGIKEQAMRFKLKIVLIFIVVFLLAVLLGGCITSKGKKLQGVVPTDHGTYRLQSAVDREKREAAEAAREAAARKKALAAVQSKQVKLPPARSKPKATAQSVEATEVPPTVSGVGKIEPFTPSVSEAKLSPSQVLIEMGKEETVSPTEILLEETSNTGEEGGVTVPEKDSPAIKVDWGSLFIYYLLAGLSIVGIYIVYKQWKGHRKTETKAPAKMRLSQKKRKIKK